MNGFGNRLYTIHPEAVWTALQEKRVLFVDPALWVCEGVPPAYEWLKNRLRHQIVGYRDHYPWFAFLEEPNLEEWKTMSAMWLEFPAWVCLELDASKIPFVAFRSWAWNRVFCQDYLALTKDEYESWYARIPERFREGEEWPPPQPWRTELELSWERLFDPNLPAHDWDESLPWHDVDLWEGVFEHLDLAAVISVRRFEPHKPEKWEPWMSTFQEITRRRRLGKTSPG